MTALIKKRERERKDGRDITIRNRKKHERNLDEKIKKKSRWRKGSEIRFSF